MDDALTYEVPVSELLTLSLRIEYLIGKLHTYINRDSPFDRQQSLSGLVELLTLLNKQELRSKYYKEFSHAYYLLSKIKDDHVCPEKLGESLNDLQAQLTLLNQKSGKFADKLRFMPFFKHLMQNSLLPLADYPNLNPEYHFWISQSQAICQNDLEQWFAHFSDIEHITQSYLSFVRKTGEFHQKTASRGFYQEHLGNKYQMVRIQLHPQQRAYPKISMGQHGASVQFFDFNGADHNPTKSLADIQFNIAYCCLY